MTLQKIIETHLTSLCELTSRVVNDNEGFYSECLNEGILNSDEYAQLNSGHGPGFANSILFYHFMYIKENDNTQEKLVQLLEQFSNTTSILKILRPKTETLSEDSTRRIQMEDVHWIAMVFTDNEKIVLNQELFYGGLGLNPAWLFPIKANANSTGNSPYNFFSGVLMKWVAMARTPTTFSALDKVLREMKFDEVADTIAHHPRLQREN